MSRTFDRDEAEAILARAALLSRGDGLSLQDLKEAAVEAGISADHVDKALVALEEDKKSQIYLERERSMRLWGVLAHLMPYLIMNGALALIDFLTPGGPWFFYPAIAWGIGLFLHMFFALQGRTPEQKEKIIARGRRRDARGQKVDKYQRLLSKGEAVFHEGIDTALSNIQSALKSTREDSPRKPARGVRIANEAIDDALDEADDAVRMAHEAALDAEYEALENQRRRRR